jgi:hypothetical protein
MPSRVDAELFNPVRRNRNPEDRDHLLGFMECLSEEKESRLCGV